MYEVEVSELYVFQAGGRQAALDLIWPNFQGWVETKRDDLKRTMLFRLIPSSTERVTWQL